MKYQGFTLDKFQEKSLNLIDQEKSLIVCAPTGAGKTLIANYAIEYSLKKGKEVIYTAPIKALSNQKFRDFCQLYGKDNVGIMTGDVTYNSQAPILIMTTEIFRNALFEDIERFNNVLYLILDEVHYLDDSERGTVWEESLIFAPLNIKILCLSATIANVEELAEWMSKIRKEEVEIIYEEKRPVPLYELCFLKKDKVLKLEDSLKCLPKKSKVRKDDYIEDIENTEYIIEYLTKNQQLPCLYFVFSRKECEKNAIKCADKFYLNSSEAEYNYNRFRELCKKYGLKNISYVNILENLITKGIAFHHAGMLPALKEIVEELFCEGLIKILFATETFALGVNMPAKSVIFDSLKKFDGNVVRYLKTLEYQQMSGRAGRRGIDKVGYVYSNLINETISKNELERITSGKVEKIKSQFNLSYSTILNIYNRVGKDVIKACDKSFGTFQKIKRKKKKKKKKDISHKKIVEKKLKFLSLLGYIKERKLTSKGRFASYINGYEIQVTELFFNGIFEIEDEVLLFIILVSLVYEGKRFERSRIPKEIRKIGKKIEKCINTPKVLEEMLGIKEEIRLPNFKLYKPARKWAEGKKFSEICQISKVPPGDLIRHFRLAIQLCRQLKKACSGYDSFIKLLQRCLTIVNRDEVNALAQLEAFADINEESEKKEDKIYENSETEIIEIEKSEIVEEEIEKIIENNK